MFREKKAAERAKPTEILSHWPQLIEKLQYSSLEFYVKIEKAIEERQVPDLKFARVEWPEGGLLSDRREYLRITRERLVFDVCGAPFGTGFFVSIWCGEKPLKLGVLAVALLVACLLGVVHLVSAPGSPLHRLLLENLNLSYQQVGLILAGTVTALVVIIAVKVGPNLDVFLMGLPIVGYVYERYFRKITYYRVDRMCMYQQAVHAAVMQVIDEITALQCIKPLSEFERRPILRELFASTSRHG